MATSEISLARRVVLLGPPGAGKGTQAKQILDAIPGVSHISTGDLFRRHQREGTELGKKAAEYMSQGALVPDEVTIAMVLNQTLPPDSPDGFLLDGFPRNLNQAQSLDDALNSESIGIDRVVHMMVPVEELVKRLGGRMICRQCQVPYHRDNAPPKAEGVCDSCGGEVYQRDDDKPEAIRTRIQVYQNETQPLVDYYRQQGNIVDVDGIGPVEEVKVRLMEALKI